MEIKYFFPVIVRLDWKRFNSRHILPILILKGADVHLVLPSITFVLLHGNPATAG